MDSTAHKEYTGVGNERILSNLAKLLKSGKRIWIRVPVIPSVNDSKENMQALRFFLEKNGKCEKVELLPYHRMGEAKYTALNKISPSFSVPSPQVIEDLSAWIG